MSSVPFLVEALEPEKGQETSGHDTHPAETFRDMWDNLRSDLTNRRRRENMAEQVAIQNAKVEQLGKGSGLWVEKVDFHELGNAGVHHTETYEIVRDINNPRPVLRRGFRFVMTITMKNRVYDNKNDQVKLIFNFGPDPSVAKNTRIIVPVTSKGESRNEDRYDSSRWKATLEKEDGKKMRISVLIDPEAYIGIWRCTVETSDQNRSSNTLTHSEVKPIFILLNPWCKEDAVYLDDEDERNECVLNDVGKMWFHSEPQAWIYGQFEDISVYTAIYMLDNSGMPVFRRGNPTYIARVVSRFVNSNNDDGIVMGKWAKRGIKRASYKDGVAPYEWAGSTPILEEFNATFPPKPVRYGQCWVFAGVTTTICRALGLPCRPITAIQSAHDTDFTLTVDRYMDENFNALPRGSDSVWNFHIWNEVWMKRPDLGRKYDGWQVIDATPQETSGGLNQCGPTSVYAVFSGELNLPFDTPFVFSEVNAQVVDWQRDYSSRLGFTKTKVNKFHIGKSLWTRGTGPITEADEDRISRREAYKAPDGSDAQRQVFLHAINTLGDKRARLFHDLNPHEGDVLFLLETIDSVRIGEDFPVIVTYENNSRDTRSVIIKLFAESRYFNGVKGGEYKQEEKMVTLKGKERGTCRMMVKPRDYLSELIEYGTGSMFAIVSVAETGQVWRAEDSFQFKKPRLSVTADAPEGYMGEVLAITFSFRNPLNIRLTDCHLNVTGPGISRNKMMPMPDVEPGAVYREKREFLPRSPGKKTMVAVFSSEEMVDIRGILTVTIRGP